jgi:hypothetical protein
VRNRLFGAAILASLLASPALAQQSDWETMPRMELEWQYAGPLRDTVIQRWRDPVGGVVCYIYLPVIASHSPPTPNGYVQYGANGIGTISCLAAPQAGAAN